MLGSPIRTPPDHSSVANSPGLIAGSYVLHRLLMPRHPPCALHSLSHKHSTKTTKIQNNDDPSVYSTQPRWTHQDQTQRSPSKHRNSVHPNPHPHGARPGMPTSCCEDARVHYPVHKKHTHPSRPPRPHPPTGKATRGDPVPEGQRSSA